MEAHSAWRVCEQAIRRRRALTGGALGPRPGFGPGERHEPGADDDPPFDDPFGGDGGVREPRRPKPAPPSMTMEAPPPEPPCGPATGRCHRPAR